MDGINDEKSFFMGISSINGSNSKCVKIVKFFFIFFILGIDKF